jgi:hypothetical protein
MCAHEKKPPKKQKKEEQMGSSLGPGDYIGGIFAGLVIIAVFVFVAIGLYYKYVRPATKGTAKILRRAARSSLMAAS